MGITNPTVAFTNRGIELDTVKAVRHRHVALLEPDRLGVNKLQRSRLRNATSFILCNFVAGVYVLHELVELDSASVEITAPLSVTINGEILSDKHRQGTEHRVQVMAFAS